MSEPKNANIDDSSLAVTLTVGQLREVYRQEREKGLNGDGPHDGDHLLNLKEAAKVLSVSKDWLYKHKKLPFVKRLGPKMLRYSYQGIQEYIASKKRPNPHY